MARRPSKCTGACTEAVSACWEPVRHGAAPLDTPHTWGPDHKAAGVWQLLNGNEIFVAPEKRRQQSSGQPDAGPICFSLVPSMQQTGRLGPRTSNASAVYGGCWLFFLLPPPPPPPPAQKPSGQQELPRSLREKQASYTGMKHQRNKTHQWCRHAALQARCTSLHSAQNPLKNPYLYI